MIGYTRWGGSIHGVYSGRYTSYLNVVLLIRFILLYLNICDSFRVPTDISPGCLTTVVKPHRAWIPMLCFHPPS